MNIIPHQGSTMYPVVPYGHIWVFWHDPITKEGVNFDICDIYPRWGQSDWSGIRILSHYSCFLIASMLSHAAVIYFDMISCLWHRSLTMDMAWKFLRVCSCIQCYIGMSWSCSAISDSIPAMFSSLYYQGWGVPLIIEGSITDYNGNLFTYIRG